MRVTIVTTYVLHSNHAFESQYPLYSVGGRGTLESLTDLVDSLKLVRMGIYFRCGSPR